MDDIDQFNDVDPEITAEIFANPRRRLVMHFLLKHGETDLDTLAKKIATFEINQPIDENDERRRAVYNALVQSHLPRMADEGLIHFDPSDGTISLTSVGQEIQPIFFAENHASDFMTYLRYALYIASLGTTVAAVVARSFVDQVATYLAPVLIAALLILLLYPSTSGQKNGPPAEPHFSLNQAQKVFSDKRKS